MKVKLERSGGVAGIRRSVTVDASALPPERAAQLRRLAGLFQCEQHAGDCGNALQADVDAPSGRRESCLERL